MSERPSVVETMFEIAQTVAKRSTCPAKHVGAVIARGDVVIALGYNGAPRGIEHCDEVGCVVIPGVGSRDSTRAANHREYSRHSHAECNCIVHCARDGRSTEGCDLYVTTITCLDCLKLIIQAGIKRVFYLASSDDVYPHKAAILAFAEEGGVEMIEVAA